MCPLLQVGFASFQPTLPRRGLIFCSVSRRLSGHPSPGTLAALGERDFFGHRPGGTILKGRVRLVVSPILTNGVPYYNFNHMVELPNVSLNQTYAAIADPTRRAILVRLMQSEARVTELAEPFDISLNAVSKHLRVLERAQLVRRRIKGRDHYLSVNIEPLQEAAKWIETYQKFWEERVDALETFLARKRIQKERKF